MVARAGGHNMLPFLSGSSDKEGDVADREAVARVHCGLHMGLQYVHASTPEKKALMLRE